MPIIWIGFSTNSPEDVHNLRNQPQRLKDYVAWVVANSVPEDEPIKPSLEDLYIEVGADRACALVNNLDDYVAVKVVTRKLGADEVRKLLPVDKAADAIQRLVDFEDEDKPRPDDEGPGPDAA
jgi:hypothetical protein